ncbi:hypothetical protein Ahy_B01g056040 [Arachis hypogaea]|uniref:Pentatricopeptide repeat-containing protein n=1 Tax=Arachis hypogaea TaxID=3818 RepID=A0A445AXV2_ARAHY|nr:hypothetical protein Ahy_B01g056040 [Arachis hypogaea]
MVREVLLEMKGSGISPNRNTYNSLVHGYCKLRRLKEAISLRDDMESLRVMPDEVTYNTLIDECFQWRGSVEAF